MKTKSKQSWVERVADKVEEDVRLHKGEGATVVCASGISPSGPIHLGNLREIMTVHLVSEELRRRGRNVDHIHSWDDFDRLRKIPSETAKDFSAHIGRPLCDIPDPDNKYESYAMRFMLEFERNMERLGIRPHYIRQSQAYRGGTYTEQIKTAMRKRFEIFDILAEYQTLSRYEKTTEQRRSEYYPFRVYCERCGKDATNISDYDEVTAGIDYRCINCNHEGSFSLDKKVEGKLVWKVDWPMRWNFEGVDFEPGGEDHSAPGSSFSVGKEIVRSTFGGHAPHFVGYVFVGTEGRSKISSSEGSSATPGAALDILEPCMLRWLYIRRDPNHRFNISFGQDVLRLYDEWDSFSTRNFEGKTSTKEQFVYERCVQTSSGVIDGTSLRVPFRLLSSAADITQGNVEQILRIVSDHLDGPLETQYLKDQIEPRLSCAIRWATLYLPDDERTHVRTAFEHEAYGELSANNKQGIQLLLEHLDEHWSLPGLTRLVYGVPKLLTGQTMDALPSEELKRVQRSFFIALYSLLCNSDTGPRLPTLILSLGKERVRSLLNPPMQPQ